MLWRQVFGEAHTQEGAFVGRSHREKGLVRQLQDTTGITDEGFPRRRERQRPTRALQEFGTQLLFQLGNLEADWVR